MRARELTTARLRLRRVRSDDLSAIHAMMSDEETMRYWSTPPHTSCAETASWLGSMIAADSAGGSDEFILEYGGEVIGKLGAWRLPEIGFFLRRDHWGNGFASEALDAFIAYARSRGVTQLTADVDPFNAACVKLLTRAGFHEVGRESATYVVGQRICDSIYLRLDLAAADE